MNRRFLLPALALSAALATGSNGYAFGLFGGMGGHDCCEPSCGCEADCGCEPSCGCESDCCDSGYGRSRCGLFGGLGGLFNRHHHHGCCEASCGCEEASCGCEEPSCGCEADCGCESSCDMGCRPRCALLGCLRGLFNRHNHGCCEASCGCEADCGCEPSCGCGM